MPWAPQLAVLAHPAVHLFVTHGGLTSMHEGLVAGKPLLVTPFFADQPGALGIRREARTN